jgi:tRNA dimethylallyltransferase
MFIIIAGSTGVGKSAVAIALAEKIDSEVVSADSMQIYRDMDIGTGKITPVQAGGIKHHLIGIVRPEEKFSTAKYKVLAEKALDEISKKGKVPILCGGTGLYINAIIKGLYDTGDIPDEFRIRARELEAQKGAAHLFELIKQKDPEEAAVIDRNNPRRLIRAVEIILGLGVKPSELKKKTAETAYKDNYRMFVINMKTDALYGLIDKRVEQMFASGLVEEVQKIAGNGVAADSTAMQGLGYKETLLYINGEITMGEAMNRIKQGSRNYAKRQLTWFRRYKEAEWIDVTHIGHAAAADVIKSRMGL